MFQWLFVAWVFVLSLVILVVVLRRRSLVKRPKFWKMSSLNCFKAQSSSKGFKNINAKYSDESLNSKIYAFPPKTVDPNSIVILLDKPPRSATATIQRPKMPPPPPPPRATISVDPPANFYELPNSRMSSYSQRDDLSWKFEDFDSDDDCAPAYSSYVGKPGVPTCPTYPHFSPINRVTVQFHGSGDTMNTHCGSSSTSSTGLSGSATPQ